MPSAVRKMILVMVMMLVGLAVLEAQAATAQTPTSSVAANSNTDSRFVSLELSMLAGLKVGPNSLTVGRVFGMAFAVSDNLAVGFYNITATTPVPATTNYSLIRLSYFLNPTLGFSIAVGADAAGTAAGAGMFVNVARSRSDTGLSTALKIRLDYLFDVSAAGGLANGDVVLSIGSSFGI